MLRLRTILAISISICISAEAAPIPPRESAALPREVRVLLGHFDRLFISGTDLVLNFSDNLEGNSVFSLRCSNNLVEYGKGKSAARVTISSHGNFITMNGKPYRGELTVFAENKSCAVVDKLDIEKYVAGLLNSEMIPSWPLEALKAQAVASRTYALHQLEANRDRYYDLESTTQDQVYEGAATETPKSNRATESTNGLILAWKHQPIKAFFHSDCGGRTENPEAVWGEKYGYIKPVVCPFHKTAQNQKHWNFRATLTQLDHALHKVVGLLPRNFVHLASLEPGPNNESERMSDLIVSDSRGNSAVISANAFRNAVGNTRIKSTSFVLRANASEVEIDGHGNGHGVGMCQIGAKAMADIGHGYNDILHFYYPLAKLERLQ